MHSHTEHGNEEREDEVKGNMWKHLIYQYF